MFHSLFHVSIFDMTSHNLLMFGMTLRRLKFPANVRVHIHKSEKLIFVHSSVFFNMNFLEIQTALLDLNGWITPILWQMLGNTLRTLREQKEHNIAPQPHQLPRFVTPRVGFGKKEIRGHTHPYHFSAFDFIIAFPVFLYRVVEACLSAVDL